MNENRLSTETSPYLLQHKDNPVHWYAWGDEPFTTAKQEGKPVLLSIGYAACHWCHVMAHESFEDPDTAELMNTKFINVKLDREERPDIDKIYMEALHHLGEQGGWPLTIFLDHERRPFWGGTYFPPTPQYGRPSFTQVLNQISHIYATAPDKITTNCDALLTALRRKNRQVETSNPIDLEYVNATAQQIHSIVDPQTGGIRGAPKFPQVPIFQLLWRHHIRTGDLQSKNLVETTLTNICQGGIYDHIGGGFCRYAVDARWLVPHFEKMLYDNAQLLDLLLEVWQQTKNQLFHQRIKETIDWLRHEMITEHAAFASSLDADSEGEEGKFYTWQKKEIETILADDAPQFCAVYGITEPGNWENTNIPNRLHNLDPLDPNTHSHISASKAQLLAVRNQRIRPSRDDKNLTDWNGLIIASLAKCGRVLNQPTWIDLAETAYKTIKRTLWTGRSFKQTYRGGKSQYLATADGYANMIRAALNLAEATKEHHYVEDALLWNHYLCSDFWNTEAGGFYFTNENATDLIRRTHTATDDATPNANATMLSNLSRLHALTGKSEIKDLADRTLHAFSREVLASGIAHAGFLNGYEDLSTLTQIIIIANGDRKNAARLKSALNAYSIPTACLQEHDNLTDLPPDHPASSKSASEHAVMYICKGQVCSLPITEPHQLSNALL